jgi:hypothetical protein
VQGDWRQFETDTADGKICASVGQIVGDERQQEVAFGRGDEGAGLLAGASLLEGLAAAIVKPRGTQNFLGSE